MLPILYQNHDVIIYSYPLFLGLAWGVAYQIFFSLLDSSFSLWKGQLIFWGIFIFSWVGAKFLYLISTETAMKNTLNFWLGGGLVFYGGLMGGICFLLLFRLFNRELNFDKIWYVFPALAAGHGIGRIGCFLAGCCFGKKTDWFWAIHQHGEFRHPTQLLEAICLITFSVLSIKLSAFKKSLVVCYCLGYGTLRIIMEALRGDSHRGMWGSFTPGVWISLGLICFGLFHLLKNNFNRLKKPHKLINFFF